MKTILKFFLYCIPPTAQTNDAYIHSPLKINHSVLSLALKYLNTRPFDYTFSACNLIANHSAKSFGGENPTITRIEIKDFADLNRVKRQLTVAQPIARRTKKSKEDEKLIF